ncbi:MAG TPA: IPExxxVDY family protein [Bacteroidales bacterium]|nr:IPExxxVDY family protein [Bacteroidales bacterium]
MPRYRKLTVVAQHNFQFIGIVSQADTYRLCFFLNKSLKLSLRRISDFVSSSATGQYEFALYYCCDDARQLNWFLVSNRTTGNTLIPSLRHFSHLLFTDKIHPVFRPEEISYLINATKSVDFAHTLSSSGIAGIDVFIQELELHLLQINISLTPSQEG